jgi:ParB family chromosome partitioning protein
MERRLGRGLGSLLGTPTAPTGEPEAPAAGATIPLDRIDPNPEQPRETFDPVALEELRDSIREHGILQPIVVRRQGDRYQLVAGERRWRAAKLAGLAEIPAVVREDIPDRSLLELALVENVQRRDLDAMERARGFQRLIDELGLTQDQVAQKVALRRSTVANHLRLLELPREAQDAIAKGLISMGHAKALVGLAPVQRLLELVQRIAREGLSVRQVEEEVRRASAASSAGSSTDRSRLAGAPLHGSPPWARELETRLRERLGTRVQVRPTTADKGRIVIEYFSRESLERILDALAPKRTVE